MPRWLFRTILALVILVGALVILNFAGLLVPIAAKGTSGMAPTVPACDGRWLAEGFTYRFRDPRRGEVVAIHATGRAGGPITPDADGRDLSLTKRVVAVPGDQIVGRGGSVFVNGVKIDDIATAPFGRADLAGDQYFVLDDNRSASQDSRDFGPILRDAIFARVFLVLWPLGDFGSPEARHAGPPPGPGLCD